MKVCHVGTLSYDRMSPCTRSIFEHTAGGHVYAMLGGQYPDADVYVLECFKKRYDEFEAFKRPRPGAKIVSMIHSTPPCRPSADSDVVVCQTRYSRHVVQDLYHPLRTVLIPSAVPTMGGWPDYDSKTFGRIARMDEGKFHSGWLKALATILDAVSGSQFLLYANDVERAEREGMRAMPWPPYEGQEEYLQRMSLAVFAHGAFEETFCSAMMECMGAGLPIVYLYQPSMHEMAGESQLCCATLTELVQATEAMLVSPKAKRHMGGLARSRARQFSPELMWTRWSALLTEIVK